jgi:hypothetical protein
LNSDADKAVIACCSYSFNEGIFFFLRYFEFHFCNDSCFKTHFPRIAGVPKENILVIKGYAEEFVDFVILAIEIYKLFGLFLYVLNSFFQIIYTLIVKEGTIG